MTLREQFVAALVARGYVQVKTASRKFLVFRDARLSPESSNATLFYVGKSGSLRRGPTIAGSIPCSEKFKAALLQEAKPAA